MSVMTRRGVAPLEAMPRFNEPACGNLSRIGDQLLGVNAAWSKLGELERPDQRDFFLELERAANLSEAQEALARFEEAHGKDARWVPFGGRWNNRGIIEIAADPGRSLVERITNAIDAILELEFDLHHGTPECRSPKEAASAWLGLPTGGLSEMSPAERRALAQRATVRVLAGDGRDILDLRY